MAVNYEELMPEDADNSGKAVRCGGCFDSLQCSPSQVEKRLLKVFTNFSAIVLSTLLIAVVGGQPP